MKTKRIELAPQPAPLITVCNSSSVISEQYRTLRSNINFSFIDNSLKTMLVTSSVSGEGKSTITDNLAVVFADSGMKTLLVDADMRRPTVAMTFHVSNRKGLSTLLSEPRKKVKSYIQSSGVEHLDLLVSGPTPPKPADMLASKRMKKLMDRLKEMYDLIIFDTPPLTQVTDAQILAAQVDGTLLVAREGETRKQTFLKSQQLLKMANANVLGIVYNSAYQSEKDGYYKYGYRGEETK